MTGRANNDHQSKWDIPAKIELGLSTTKQATVGALIDLNDWSNPFELWRISLVLVSACPSERVVPVVSTPLSPYLLS